MTDERWEDLMCYLTAELTDDEIAAGWHFCPDSDDLLVGPGMDEIECCHCEPY